eukprot:2353289-Heterocapsa_arctica.AAC.1
MFRACLLPPAVAGCFPSGAACRGHLLPFRSASVPPLSLRAGLPWPFASLPAWLPGTIRARFTMFRACLLPSAVAGCFPSGAACRGHLLRFLPPGCW